MLSLLFDTLMVLVILFDKLLDLGLHLSDDKSVFMIKLMKILCDFLIFKLQIVYVLI